VGGAKIARFWAPPRAPDPRPVGMESSSKAMGCHPERSIGALRRWTRGMNQVCHPTGASRSGERAEGIFRIHGWAVSIKILHRLGRPTRLVAGLPARSEYIVRRFIRSGHRAVAVWRDFTRECHPERSEGSGRGAFHRPILAALR